jgi:hypothetical protein
MCEWIKVEDELPEIEGWGTSRLVMLSVFDKEYDHEEAERLGMPPHERYTEAGYLKELSNGTTVWVKEYNESPVEELDLVVEAWAKYPEPLLPDKQE